MDKIKSTLTDKDELLQRTAVIDHPAKRLWYIGELPKVRPTVAVVGSRKPTSYGRAVNQQIVSELARHDIIIVSGLAIGHDGLAHQACLDAGGITIGVIASGLRHIYPRTNQRLAERIVDQGGAIISEYPPDEQTIYKDRFLERNRLISALADIVVVIEAGERSGTLNTASHALSQGKEVMAVPGNINSPLSVGCNRLIAEGAAPVLSAQDILDHLGIAQRAKPNASSKIRFDSPDAQKVYDLILSGIEDGEELAMLSHLEAGEFTMALTMLELNGYIMSLGNNHWSRKG